MNLLILDTETTGLHPSKGASIIEVGALLYNVEHRQVLQTLSTFFPCSANDAEHINHIKSEWTRCEMAVQMPCRLLNEMASCADFLVAHNASFDIAFLKTLLLLNDYFWNTPWLCTKDNFDWGVPLPRKRLQDICEALKVPYVDAHRALTDCQFIADCFSRVPDLEARLSKQ